MKPISTFFPRMLPYLPGCSEPLAQQALLDAAIVFCEDTQALRAELDDFETAPGQAAYELNVPSAQQVARILEVRVEGRVIPAVAAEDVNLLNHATGHPMAYYTDRTDSQFTLRLFPTPDDAYTVSVRAAVRPTRDADVLEDDLFDLWSDAVLFGAVARVMAVPGQPFSDPAGSMNYSIMAARAASKARVEGNFGRVRSTSRVRGRPFV